MEDKIEKINRAAKVVGLLKRVEREQKTIEKIIFIGIENEYNRLDRNTDILSKEDIWEGIKLLKSFYKERHRIKVKELTEELEKIQITSL